jgi:hypothetical protein
MAKDKNTRKLTQPQFYKLARAVDLDRERLEKKGPFHLTDLANQYGKKLGFEIAPSSVRRACTVSGVEPHLFKNRAPRDADVGSIPKEVIEAGLTVLSGLAKKKPTIHTEAIRLVRDWLKEQGLGNGS